MEASERNRILAVLLLIATALGLSVWFLSATLLHPLLTATLFDPAFGAGIASLLLAVVMFPMGRRRAGRVLTLSGLLLLVLSIFAPMAAEAQLASEIRPVSGLILDNVTTRVLPYEVARYYMYSAIKGSWEFGDLDPIVMNGTMYWEAPLEPPGLQAIAGSTGGLVLQNAFTTQPDARVIPVRFPDSETTLLTNIRYRITLGNPLVNPEQVIYGRVGGRWYMIVSLVAYEFRGFYSKPYFAGVYLLDQNGSLEFVPYHQLIRDERFSSLPVYPVTLAGLYGESWEWRTGVVNSLLYHRNQEVIDEYAGGVSQENTQPYLAMWNGRPVWLFFYKPYGSGKVLSKVLIIDAVNGSRFMVDVSGNRWAGPSWVSHQVIRFRPNYVFVSGGSDDEEGAGVRGFVMREPMPVMRNGSLIWRVAITPSDGSGVSEMVYVDARTGEEVSSGRNVQVGGEVNGTSAKVVVGIPELVAEYVKNGNTRWIVRVNETTYLVKVEDLGWRELARLRSGHPVKLLIRDDEVVEVRG